MFFTIVLNLIVSLVLGGNTFIVIPDCIFKDFKFWLLISSEFSEILSKGGTLWVIVILRILVAVL